MLTFDLTQSFEEAVKHFEAKGIALSPNGWRDLWEAAHAKAFTVARVADDAMLSEIKAMVLKAQVDGLTFKQFAQELTPKLAAKGWLAPDNAAGLTPSRLHIIYSTNIASSYNVGRYQQMQDVKQFRPYWRYMGVLDGSTRPTHAAMQGKVYPADDPIWKTWYPPNGFRCRCYIQALRDKDMQRLGLTPDGAPPIDAAGAPVVPDEGWRYNPGESGYVKPQGTVKPKAKPKPKPKPTAPQVENADGWQAIGGRLGTNQGGKYQSETGKAYYVKFYSDDNQTRAEKAANDIALKLGIGAPNSKLITINGKMGIASEWIDSAPPLKQSLNRKLNALEKEQLTKQYLNAALVNNWDVVGFDYDNLVKVGNKWTVIDSGGAFDYKATGGKKAWGASADAVHSLLSPDYKSGKFFSQFAADELAKKPQKYSQWLAQLTDRKISDIIKKAGLPTDYAATLISRRDDITAQIAAKINISAGRKTHARGHLGRSMNMSESQKIVLNDAQTHGAAVTPQRAAEIVDSLVWFTTNDGYQAVNRVILQGGHSDATLKKVFDIEDYLDFSAKFKANGAMYRGMRSNMRGILENLTAGEVFDPKKICSHTTDEDVAERFAGQGGVILRHTAIPDLSATIQHLSKYYGESEFLVSGRVRWKVVNKQIKRNGILYIDVIEDNPESLSGMKERLRKTMENNKKSNFAEDSRLSREEIKGYSAGLVIKHNGDQILYTPEGGAVKLTPDHPMYNHDTKR